MIINHNMSAIFAHRQQKLNSWAIDKDMEKLSSGMRINRAGDDASGLAVSEKMRSQIRGLRRAEKNAMDGISFSVNRGEMVCVMEASGCGKSTLLRRRSWKGRATVPGRRLHTTR